MDGTKFAKMLSDKNLFELDRMAYKYSATDVKDFSELLRQNFAQPLPLVDFAGQAFVCLPNLAQISTKSMKQLLSVPAESQPFGVQAMTEEIHATLQIENIHSTRNSIRHILNGNALRNEEENRIYGMKRGLDFIADQHNEITEENLHQLYQISTGEYLPAEDKLLPDYFYRHDDVYIVGGEESRKGLSDRLLPQTMKQLIDFANAEDDLNELHKAAILHFALAYYHPYFDGNGRTARLLHLWYLARHGYPAALFTPFSRYIAESKGHIIKPMSVWRKTRCSPAIRQIQHQLLFRCFGKRESVFLTLAHRLGALFRIFPMVFAACSFAFSSRWRTEGRSDCVRAFVLASSLSAAVKASESRALKNTRTRGLSPSTLRIA